MLRIFMVSLILMFVSGCSGKHVTFFHQNAVPDLPRQTRIFLDARGDLYPRTGLPAEYVLPDAAEGSLFEAARGADRNLCARPAEGSELTQLCAVVASDCAGPETATCFARWQEVQARLWKQRGAMIAANFSADGGAVTVGVLIHGFNNWYREIEANYATAQKQMGNFLEDGQSLHFVEVYWDGCRSNDAGIGCWSKAQSTGPLAGFALRQMFNAVEETWPPAAPKPNWRVLTHSSGAFVAGATFGNPISALPQLQNSTTNRWYGTFADHSESSVGPYRVPSLANVKLGMFAAATPRVTFSGTSGLGGGVRSPGLTILSAVQPDDSALNKKGIGCSRFGASCLGLKRDQLCDLKKSIASGDLGISVTGYDFTRSPAVWRDETTLHDYTVYVRQAAQNSTFFRDLMMTGSDHPQSESQINCN